MAAATAAAAPRTALAEVDEVGAFKRTPSAFRRWVEPGSAEFPPAAGRYHLYVSLACPWASRCVALLYMKGLEHVVGLSVTHPTWQRTRPDDATDLHAGWIFKAPGDAPVANPAGKGAVPCDSACVPDAVNGARSVRELYDLGGGSSGKYTVPLLWDTHTKSMVNNESADIVRMLNSSFDAFALNPQLDLYPPHLRVAIDVANEWIYPAINNGVYRCGFATTQAAYDAAFDELDAAIHRLETILEKQRYVAGDGVALTEADIRLFVTLVRFDDVYYAYFKTCRKLMRESSTLKGYIADVYQTPGVGRSVDLAHIRYHYWTSHPLLNAHAVVPRAGPEWWKDAAVAEARRAQFA